MENQPCKKRKLYLRDSSISMPNAESSVGHQNGKKDTVALYVCCDLEI